MRKAKKDVNTYYKLPTLDGLELLNAKSHTIDFPFHTHDTFNIALILNATFNTKLSDKFLKAPVGTLSITNPHEVHATPCERTIGNSFFTFYISPVAMQTFNKGENVFFEDRIIYDAALFQKLYFLSRNFHKADCNFETALVQAIKALITKYACAKPFKRPTTRLFQEFINETNLEAFSLNKTACQFGLNKYKFLRLFKQETGLTPNNYIILKRIEQSKTLLRQGYPIFDAAIASGFYDAAHLCRHFKKFTGVTPLTYKEAVS